MRLRNAVLAAAGAAAIFGLAVNAQQDRMGGAPAPGKSLTEHVTVRPGDLKWTDAPPILPRGMKVAAMEGDPATKDRLFTLRLKLPANSKVAPHTHGTDEHVTVISGEFQLGMGEKESPTGYQSYKPGSFLAIPAGHAHYARAKGETVIQLHGMGPWTLVYVNPEDDPSRGVGGAGKETK